VVVERFGEVDIEFYGVHLATVEYLNARLDEHLEEQVAEERLELYRSNTGQYVISRSGHSVTSSGTIADSPEKVVIELMDKSDILWELQKRLLREAGRYDPAMKKVSTLNLSPDVIRRLANAVATVSEGSRPELEEHLIRIERSIDDDPSQAIGSAKELVESVGKSVIQQYGRKIDASYDFPRMMKEAFKLLALAPESVSDATKGAAAAKSVLAGLNQIVHGMAELRNLYGTGHGRTQKSPAEKRHARLAVGAAATLCQFALLTLETRTKSRSEAQESGRNK
jgi:hypothetical protein